MNRIALVVVASILAAGCTDGRETGGGSPTTEPSASASTSAPALRQPVEPTYADSPCQFDSADFLKVTCGILTVPENRERNSERRVNIAVARIHSTSLAPEPDPIVYLHGGPGGGALGDGVDGYAFPALLSRRDVIVIDQRGAGRSTPQLNCPEREAAFLDTLATTRPFSEDLASYDAAITACHDRLVGEGIDLDGYNTVQNADDLDDLRTALGIDKWNLWGASYGTRLALESMRSHPEGIRSVVLDSVYPPGAGEVDDVIESGERAFAALAKGCAADTTCHRAIPDLSKLIDTLFDRLEKSPISITYKPIDGEPQELTIGGQDALGGLFTAMYRTDYIPLLPKIINDLSQGDNSIIPEIANIGIPFVNGQYEGAYFSIDCADNASRAEPALVDQLRRKPGRAALQLLTGSALFCRDWPTTPLPTSFAAAVTSDIPTLVVAGEYDPITPPAWSRQVADDLGNAIYVEVPHGGHGPTSTNPCTERIFETFFDDLTGVDTSCVATLKPAPFVI